MKMRIAPRTLLAAASLAIAMPAMAQNLLQDPNFGGTLGPWVPFFAVYDGDHSELPDGTGSAAVTVPDSNGIGVFAIALQECVSPIVPGARYSFGGGMRIEAGASAGGTAKMELEWHNTPDCSDGLSAGQTTNPVSNPPGPTDTWQTLQQFVVAPAGATSAKFYVLVANSGPLPASAPIIRPEAAVTMFVVSVDDLFLDPAPIVPMLGGRGLALLVVSLAGVGYFVLRR